jgi:NADH dehydrogenase/NADH:ubiquinone oxidoreductase subunit G
LLLAASFDVPEVVALGKSLGVENVRFKLASSDACVLCGLCVRACREIVGVSAISMINRGISKQVSPPFEVASASCIGCGTCVLICPTGKMRLEDVFANHRLHPSNGHHLPFACQLCDDAAQISVNGREG